MRSAHIVAALAGLMAPARQLAPREGDGRGEGHRPDRARKPASFSATAPFPGTHARGRAGRAGDEGRSGVAPRTAGGIKR